jgi:hypothetical protein
MTSSVPNAHNNDTLLGAENVASKALTSRSGTFAVVSAVPIVG